MIEKKFRAWDKIDGRLITHEQDFIPLKVTNIGVFRLDVESEKWELLPKDRFRLMEGLSRTDMHGTEVYEGDIITSHIKDLKGKMSVGLITYNDSRLGIVCLSNISCPSYDNATDAERLAFLTESCTVLGNIFEDRELIPSGAIDCPVSFLERLDSCSTTPKALRAPEDTSLCCIRP